MQLNQDDIHIWSTPLTLSEHEQNFSLLLSPDELERAHRFRFPEHKRRFIIARSVLRQIISFYTKTAPEKVIFSYGEYKKPALKSAELQFNLAHSEELAVYAIAHQAVGIDIEKIKSSYEPDLPGRFFSPQECKELEQRSNSDRPGAFYQLWARKEAIIKASGKGLATSLSGFSVSSDNISEIITFADEKWHLHPIEIDPAFAAALASQHTVKKLAYYNFIDHIIKI